MRSLILGAGGQIGAHLFQEALSRGHIVEGTYYRRGLSGCVPLDLCDAESVSDVVREFEPDCVFLAAGMSQIDYAENHAEECHAIAAEGTANVATSAVMAGARVVLFTSDQVFGECQHPVREDTDLAPLSEYGKAQASSEAMLQRLMPDRHLIVRTSTVFGPHDLQRNLVLHAVRRLSDNHTITAAKDRRIQPTYAPDLARAVFDCVEQNVHGTIHLVGSERLTESAFLKQIAFIFGYDCDSIEPVPAIALCEDAPRPNSPWLDRARMRHLLGSRAIRTLSEALRGMRDGTVVPLRRAA